MHKTLVRTSARVERRKFEDIKSFKWKHKEHINGLEIEAAKALLEWGLHTSKYMNSKIINLPGSQVAISALWRVKSSS